MLKHLLAIAVILFGSTLAWMVLGGTLVTRTADSDSGQTGTLQAQWGKAQVQSAPDVTAKIPTSTYDAEKKSFVLGSRVENEALSSSKIDVALDLQRRRDGLLWYNLYSVRFAAHYTVKNASSNSELTVRFPFPSSDGTYTDFSCAIGGTNIANAAALTQGIPFTLAPGKETSIDVSYLSRGMDSWQYTFGTGVASVNNFDMTMTTNFDLIGFPNATLLPTAEQQLGGGHRLTWHYTTLVSGDGIGMTIPDPLQPGPLAQRITFWAPLALFFYVFVILVMTTLRKIELHPVNYFFLACAFFAFHLLFAYLVDRLPIELAFAICSVVSMFLTVSYLRLVVGWRFAAIESGLAQLVYLVLFSYALFNEGWSGLSITIGVIVTLFVVMQVTGRVRWSEHFAPKAPPAALA